MITAVDTSVLVDVFEPDPEFGARSGVALRRCLNEGSLMACDVVWAEVAGRYPEMIQMQAAMGRLGVVFSPLGLEDAVLAGVSWHGYRQRGGARDRLLADFLIGAHALVRADRLLTRDRGFFRTYFVDLEILDPSAS